MAKGKPSRGSKKIEIKCIKHKDKRQVCFSKRCQGMFKKASELSILCGAMVGAVVFSPGGRPFSFGSPSLAEVVDRFDTMGTPSGLSMGGGSYSSDGVTSAVHEMSLQCEELNQLVEAEKMRKERVKQEEDEREYTGRLTHLLNANPYALGLDKTKELLKELEANNDALQTNIKQELQERQAIGPQPLTSVVAPNSSYEPADRPDVNNSLVSGAHGVGGLMDSPKNQFGG